MKRYTLRFNRMGSALTVDALHSEVDQVLLRLHPRITYKLGQAFEGVDGKLLVEFTADGKRKLLEDAFTNRTWSLPVQFERLCWGWRIENEDAALLTSADRPMERDPLAGVAPVEGVKDYFLGKQLLHGRYIALMISTLALILILIGNLIYPRSPALMVSYAVVFAIFMFTLSDTPLDLRVYGDKLSLRLDGLEVKFWMLAKGVFIEWENISGVDYTNHICEILGKNKKIRFLLSDRFGCRDQSGVLKTIITRAGLRYVEGSFRMLVYRKPDA